LVERDGKTQRVLDGKTEKEVSAMLEGYEVGLSDREYERSPLKLEIASGYRSNLFSPTFHPPFPTPANDISSVHFPPVPVMAQAEMTSTYDHPWLNLPEMGKVNIGTRRVGFDVCREKEREKWKRKRGIPEREKWKRERERNSRGREM